VTALPTGTVTFLFTDLEGSTRLWEEHPEAMKAALARHDELVRGAIEEHGGSIVKTTGDGAHAAFATAEAAVRAALGAQLALRDEPWPETTGPLRVRIGLHTGSAELRDGDYYGSAANRAARVMAVAHGGQVLCSQATADLVRDVLAEGTGLVDLGEHRLRDLSRPERVFQVAAVGLHAEFGPLRSVDALPGNLPVQLSSFVGRDQEIDRIAAAFDGARVVTITGVGGVGKTRLAVQVAAELLPRYQHGAWLCELAAATDAETMTQVIAATLGVRPRPETTLEGSIVEYLRGRTLLLVLDNCEHLLDAAGRIAEGIVRECPHVQVLATSREGLAVEGERAWPLRSLTLPEAGATASGETGAATASAAVQLFVDRAAAARPGFALDRANAVVVSDICRRLDGMPLAIELAAARVVAMSPAEIAGLLDERFRLLTGGRRTAVERHQTLRAAVDWSYSMLSEVEQRAFERLGVFSGTFDATAATHVVAGDGVEVWDAIDALASLVSKSMVVADETGEGTTRYSMLETLRQYARERLEETGDSDRWRRRHAEHYAALAEEAGPALYGPDELVWRRRLHADLDNLRAASRGRSTVVPTATANSESGSSTRW
jgi:predicted ATPase/class 3 adenylate cyclase